MDKLEGSGERVEELWPSESLENKMVDSTMLPVHKAAGQQIVMGPASDSLSEQSHCSATQVTNIK